MHMRFHFMGKNSGNPDDLPYIEHEPGAVAFKEAQDSKLSAISPPRSRFPFLRSA